MYIYIYIFMSIYIYIYIYIYIFMYVCMYGSKWDYYGHRRTIDKYINRYGRRKRKGKGLLWAWKDCSNRGEENTIKTTVKELAKGAGEASKWVCEG